MHCIQNCPKRGYLVLYSSLCTVFRTAQTGVTDIVLYSSLCTVFRTAPTGVTDVVLYSLLCTVFRNALTGVTHLVLYSLLCTVFRTALTGVTDVVLYFRFNGCWTIMRPRKESACHAAHCTTITCDIARSRTLTP